MNPNERQEMIKYKCELEVVKGDKKYIFLSDHDAPLTEVLDVLSEMRIFALNIMNDAIRQQQEAKDQLEKDQQIKEVVKEEVPVS
jgi:hypothetical protein